MTIQEKYRLHLKSLSDELLILQKPIRILMPSSGPVTCRPTFWPVEDIRCLAVDKAFYDGLPSASIPATSIWSSRSCGTGSAAGSAPGRAWPHPARDGGSIHGGHRDAASAANRIFLRYSQLLYGSVNDHLRGDRKTLKELGARLCDIFSCLAPATWSAPTPRSSRGSGGGQIAGQAVELFQ